MSRLYSTLRNIHLALGLFVAVFLLAYGLSAVQMAYPIYRPEPRETEWTIDAIPDAAGLSPRALAAWLMIEHGLRGDLTETADENGVVSLTIVRPGTTYLIDYEPEAHVAHVTASVHNAIGMLNRIHHVRGIGHDYWINNAWGWLLLVGSLALAMLAVTGVVMWFVRHDERRLGALVLGGGLAWGVTLLILIRIA